MNEPSDDGVSAADAVAPAKIMATGSCATRVMTWSARQSAPVQARDRVERGQNRVQGKGEMWLQNGNGVYLRLKARREGLALSLGADGMIVRLGG
jgi:hypothetical protein